MNKGYAIIQLPEYLQTLFNYLKNKGKNHPLYGNKADDIDISTHYNKTKLNYAKTGKSLSTVTVKPNDAPLLDERVNSLELTVKNIESRLEKIKNSISLE